MKIIYFIPFRGIIYQELHPPIKINNREQEVLRLKDRYAGEKFKLKNSDSITIYNELFSRLSELGYIQKNQKRIQMQTESYVFVLKLSREDIDGIKKALPAMEKVYNSGETINKSRPISW